MCKLQTKKYFCNNFHVTGNKHIGKTVQPSLSNKTLRNERITLTENGKVVSDKRELVKTSIEYFQILYQT